jgi:hypothetical protein
MPDAIVIAIPSAVALAALGILGYYVRKSRAKR